MTPPRQPTAAERAACTALDAAFRRSPRATLMDQVHWASFPADSDLDGLSRWATLAEEVEGRRVVVLGHGADLRDFDVVANGDEIRSLIVGLGGDYLGYSLEGPSP